MDSVSIPIRDDGLQIDEMAERLQLKVIDTRHIGNDLRLLLRPAADAS